jgi:hypothetical protein
VMLLRSRNPRSSLSNVHEITLASQPVTSKTTVGATLIGSSYFCALLSQYYWQV